MAGTVSQGQLRHREVGWGGSLEAKLGADEQEPDRRPMRWGNPAMDGEAQRPNRHCIGKSGGARGKVQNLTPGDLTIPLGEPEKKVGNDL